MSSSVENVPSMKISASTLDNYAAAAGRKYAKLNARIAQKIKSVPVLNKAVEAVKKWDKKMTETHGAAYKFAKGAVLGATIGVGLAVAGAEVAAAYTAVNAVRAAGSLLAQAEQARQEGKATGFSDFAAKNKTAVGLAAVSVGLAATGVAAGVIDNPAAAPVISSVRGTAVRGVMAVSTAVKMHKIEKAARNGEITAEQAKQAKKEHMAEFAGNMVGLAAVATASTQTEALPESPLLHQSAESHAYDGGVLPEVTVMPDAPSPVPDPAQTVPAPDFVKSPDPFTAPVNPETPMPDAQPLTPDTAPRLDAGIDPVFHPIPDQQPQTVPETPETAPAPHRSPEERDTFVSFANTVSPSSHTVDLDIADNIRAADGENHQESSLYASVHDIKGSDAKLMSFNLVNDGETRHIPEMHIAADGRVTPLPDWENVPDADGDGRLSDQEIREWSTKRQASLQSVLSEQEAKSVTATEIDQERKLYNGTNTQSVHVERAAGQHSGPAGHDNPAARARETGARLTDKIASAARDMMTTRIDASGNTVHVAATEQQISVADILLRSAAAKSK